MGLPWTAFAVSSIVGSILLVHMLPQSLISTSYFRAFFTLFLAQAFTGFVWSVIVYPKFFNPLRNLPTPPVIPLIPSYGKEKLTGPSLEGRPFAMGSFPHDHEGAHWCSYAKMD